MGSVILKVGMPPWLPFWWSRWDTVWNPENSSTGLTLLVLTVLTHTTFFCWLESFGEDL